MNKKFWKYMILSVTFAAGVTAAIVGYSMGADADFKEMLNLTNIDAVVPATDVNSINIDVSYVDIEIAASNNVENIEISAENVSRNFLKYSTISNSLNLNYSVNKWYEISSVPIILNKKGKIKITVPAEEVFQDVQIKSGFGKMSLKYVTAENISINGGSGDNEISSINAGYVDIKGGSGDCFIDNITSDKFVFNGAGGDTEISSLNTADTKIISGLGDVHVSGILNGNCNLKSGTGDINAEIFGSINDYKIKILSGNASVNGKKSGGTNTGKYKINIKSGMGDVNINFK